MSTEELFESLLRENNRLVKENNKILRKMRRASIISFWSRIIFLVVMIGGPYLAYKYYFEDYFIDLQTTYADIKNSATQLQELPKMLPF